jgi:hypothetical protein
MRKTSSLTLGNWKSLYPQIDLDTVGDWFAATWTEEETDELVQSFIETMTLVIEMIPVGMS